LVSSWYERFLDRPADAAGLNAFVAQIGAGRTDEQVIAALVATDEFFAKTAE
jgi:hypothetical protein